MFSFDFNTSIMTKILTFHSDCFTR